MNHFLPIDRMLKQRIDIESDESDAAQFLCLLYLGEMLTKSVVSGLVACIEDNQSRYRQTYALVRADGIGKWVEVLHEVLKGPTSQDLVDDVHQEQRELTERAKDSHWGHQACEELAQVFNHLKIAQDPIPNRVDARHWFTLFGRLRNSTRGHGATMTGLYTAACPPLRRSILLLYENLHLFSRPWAFLHQNLSTKYRVTPLTDNEEPFRHLKSEPSKYRLEDGIYICVGEPRPVELILSDVDASDFFFPNGQFNGKQYQILSYLTDSRKMEDASRYIKPARTLPNSETHGRAELDVVGNVHTNLPPSPEGYVIRSTLQKELINRLSDDRHPVITLLGRGGIGKTSLALATLYGMASLKRFDVIIWFSARDIDLMPQRPILVTPRVSTAEDIAREYFRLTGRAESQTNGIRNEEIYKHLDDGLSRKDMATLFVFDNFETVRNLIDVYMYLSEQIRLPNKLLITTRTRDFKADYPIEVAGMTQEESDKLVTQVASTLNISHLISKRFRCNLIELAEGHPYILKILLGQVASENREINISSAIEDKEEILDALFERTFLSLNTAAQRVFLTLCGWRSTVPELAIEAVLTARSKEPIDVSSAIEELIRWSLVEYLHSESDNERFLITPLAAATFGRRKLLVHPAKSVIEADLEVLQQIGGLQRTAVRHGATNPLKRLAHKLVQRIAREPNLLDEYTRILEYMARRVPSVWQELSQLSEEEQDNGKAIYYMQRFLGTELLTEADRSLGWDRLASLYRRNRDGSAEMNALVEKSELHICKLSEISNIANAVNSLLRQHMIDDQLARHKLVARLISSFERTLETDEATATDLSRLAWLYLHVKQDERALEIARKGLAMEPDNIYCERLIQSLVKR